MISWPLLLISIIFAFIAIIIFWKVSSWYFLNNRPWKRIHFPMIITYAHTSGFESGRAEKEGRQFNISKALQDFIKTVRPQWNSTQIENFVKREYARCESFWDEILIRNNIIRTNNKATKESIDKFIEGIKEHFNIANNALIVRMVIAGFIEDKYGLEQRGEYLLNVVRNKVD